MLVESIKKNTVFPKTKFVNVRDILDGNYDICLSKLVNSNVMRAKILAIAFADNYRILTFAVNQVFRGSKLRWTYHAEENLIKKLYKIKAKQRFGNINVLVMRLTIDGWSMAKPCNKCYNDLMRYGVNRILYTDVKGKIREI